MTAAAAHTSAACLQLLREAVGFMAAGRFKEAEKRLLTVLTQAPGHSEALNALGSVYRSLGQPVRAADCYRDSLSSDPRSAPVWANLGRICGEMKDIDGAVAAYEQSLAIDNRNAQACLELIHLLAQSCRWEKRAAHLAQLERLLESGAAVEAFKLLVHLPERHYDNTLRWAKKTLPGSVPYNPARALPSRSRKDGRLRIGYLSSDFYSHATLYLMSELFEQHERGRFEIYAYAYNSPNASAERKRVEQSADHFCDIHALSDADAATRIEADGIDILVDLKGYTQGHRLGIVARRPAPLQMHYLGYPGTIGTRCIDYFIGDAVAAPKADDFHECLIRLPHSYQINDRKRPLPGTTKTRADFGLPNNAFVFGAMNAPYKITPEIFTIWMRLLAKIENSVLWLYAADGLATAALTREAEARGIAASRLIFAPAVPMSEHMERYGHVDLFLDTSPTCGHTTASDALWCGVPVVTLAGETFASRVAASLLHAVHLSELVTHTLSDYETLCLRLAKDRAKLLELRHHLDKNRMTFPLFDNQATTRAIETAYQHAAEWHRNGKIPHTFSVTADGGVAP